MCNDAVAALVSGNDELRREAGIEELETVRLKAVSLDCWRASRPALVVKPADQLQNIRE